MWWMLCVLWLPSLAHAEEPQAALSEADEARARTLFENGKRLYSEGSYQAAIVAWDACHELSGHPELLFNLSNAHERLGNLLQALEYLNRYRAQAELAPEEHDRLARKASTLELRLSAELPARRTRQLSGRDAAGAAAIAGGGVALVAGTVLGMLALDARREVQTTCLETSTGLVCPDGARAGIRRAEQSGTWSLVALGAGGVGVLSGVTLVLTPGPRSNARLQVSWAF